jgi:hypothetical protein
MRPLASIAAMQGPKPILILLCLLASAGLASGCGDEEPKPSIPLQNATTLVSTLQEIQDNVDAGSCLIAADKVQEFQDELSQLPSDVNNDVLDALQRGALSLGDLIEEDCDQPEETTTEETTTDEDTTTEETTTEETTTEQTTTEETTTEPPPNTGDGGIGPPGSDGL